MTSFGRRSAPVSVALNVYDLAPANELLHPVGLGIYHTGVEISGSEYTFADSAGIFSHPPRSVPQAKFREQIDLGSFEGAENGAAALVQSAVRALAEEKFGPNDYHILQNNCNHFAKALVWKLLQKQIPAYINRMADIGVCCSCLIPKKLLENAPVNDEQSSETSSFLVKAPVNYPRQNATTTTSMVFAGSGSKLGGGSTTTTTVSTTSSSDALTDRREKARMAALARLERQQQQQQQQSDSDKSH